MVKDKLPPTGMGPSPELEKVGYTEGSGLGPPLNGGLLQGSEWSQGGRKCGMVVSCIIGKPYQVETYFSIDWKNSGMSCGVLCKRIKSY